MAIRKERNRHLTDDLRLELEVAVRAHKSFSQIKRELGIPRSTIKREIMNHREESTRTFYGRRFNPCTHRDSCKAYGMCARPDCTRSCANCGLRCRRDSCPRFEEEACPRLAAARLLPGKCARHVTDAFNRMWNALGESSFRTPFPRNPRRQRHGVLQPPAIETFPEDGSRRTGVFYARPHRATDKAQAERNHEYVSRVVFKGESLDSLTQEHVDLMMSHVNGYVRASPMKGAAPCLTPYGRFTLEYGGQIAERLGTVPIPLEEATLRPELLEMN